MREIRQSGSEGGGNEQTVSPYPYWMISVKSPWTAFHGSSYNPLTHHLGNACEIIIGSRAEAG